MRSASSEKVLVVDSPSTGKDKIGRVPLAQAAIATSASAMASSDTTKSRFRLPTRSNKPSTSHDGLDADAGALLVANDDGGDDDGGRPPVPPKEPSLASLLSTPDSTRNNSIDLSHGSPATPFRPSRLTRTMSIASLNSLSRLSFSSQINQLTSISLPDADTLASSLAAIATSPKAARTLIDAASQIQSWMGKAKDVLEGLDAAGDVDWAAAAGRDGVGEVDGAIKRFESLIQVYIASVEDLQSRKDVATIPSDDMQLVVSQLEKIVTDWARVKGTLTTVKKQVELALEWEQLRDSVVQDIGGEISALSRQIFELEEKRHMARANPTGDGGDPSMVSSVDIGELETIVEEAPIDPTKAVADTLMSQDDSVLLGLFAQMQPLRASLDFLPMRFAGYQRKAQKVFPTACEDLDSARQDMEDQWKRLEADAESLRRELGEDRWILVFRNAGKQAVRMIDSVGRAITRLDESLDSNTRLRHATGTIKKIENYEAKKLHYGPAIERVIGIVDRGVKDRLTVNGEILRLQHELQNKWQTVKTDMKSMDSLLDTYESFKTQQLRDSVSSILSSDPSFLSSNIDTPGSSSASSIHTPDRRLSEQPPLGDSLTPYAAGKPRQLSSSSTSSRPNVAEQPRHVSSPASSRIPRKTAVTRSSAADLSIYTRSSSLSPSYRAPLSPASSVASSKQSLRSSPANSSTSKKPRWNGSIVPTGNTFSYYHPHPGRPPTPPSGHKLLSASNTPTSRRLSSSTATPQVSRRPSRPPSATPSPNVKRTTGPSASLARSWGPGSTNPVRKPSLQEPSSPSPVRPASAFGSRPASSLSIAGRRTSMIPLASQSRGASPIPTMRISSTSPEAARDPRRYSNLSNTSALSESSRVTVGRS